MSGILKKEIQYMSEILRKAIPKLNVNYQRKLTKDLNYIDKNISITNSKEELNKSHQLIMSKYYNLKVSHKNIFEEMVSAADQSQIAPETAIHHKEEVEEDSTFDDILMGGNKLNKEDIQNTARMFLEGQSDMKGEEVEEASTYKYYQDERDIQKEEIMTTGEQKLDIQNDANFVDMSSYKLMEGFRGKFTEFEEIAQEVTAKTQAEYAERKSYYDNKLQEMGKTTPIPVVEYDKDEYMETMYRNNILLEKKMKNMTNYCGEINVGHMGIPDIVPNAEVKNEDINESLNIEEEENIGEGDSTKGGVKTFVMRDGKLVEGEAKKRAAAEYINWCCSNPDPGDVLKHRQLLDRQHYLGIHIYIYIYCLGPKWEGINLTHAWQEPLLPQPEREQEPEPPPELFGKKTWETVVR